jgi:hypothetical protein
MQIATFLRRIIFSSVDCLALPYISTNPWQGNIPYCENHNPKDLQEDEAQDTGNKNIAHSTANTPNWTRSKAVANFRVRYWTWLPCETSISHRVILPFLLHTLRLTRREGPTPFVQMQCYIFNVWKSKILGGKMSNGCLTLSTYPPLEQITTFPHYLINGTIFINKLIKHKRRVLILSTTFVWNISNSKKNSARYHKYTEILMESTRYSSQNLVKRTSSVDFLKILKYKNFMKIRAVGTELCYEDRQWTDRKTCWTRLKRLVTNVHKAKLNMPVYFFQ